LGIGIAGVSIGNFPSWQYVIGLGMAPGEERDILANTERILIILINSLLKHPGCGHDLRFMKATDFC